MNEKINILLVDDRPEGLVTLEAVLTDPEYRLVKAGSGLEALSQVLNHDFAVILMDVQMPAMDGFETAAMIKRREKSKYIPIVFLTAINKDDHFVSRGYSVGAVDYVFKPFDSYALQSKVAVFVDLYKKEKQIKEQAEVLRDIERRERLRLISELENEGRKRYQNLADAIPQIVFRLNNSGAIEYANQHWQVYSGNLAKGSINGGWERFIHSEDIARIKKNWEVALQSQVGFEAECRFRRGQDGEFRWHLLRVAPEFSAISEVQTWIGFATEIHEHKLVQQELLKAKKIAEVANETKSRFLANMSHEIRTPLGAILGFSELLLDKETDAATKSKTVSAIRRNGILLSKVIDEILDLSKVEAGKLDIEITQIGVIELLNDINVSMDLLAKSKKLNLKFNIEKQIPTRIFSNAVRLQQIVVNVIGNAIKFSSEGRVDVGISFEPAIAGGPGFLCIGVQDSGPGLNSEQIKNLFQPFVQVDSSLTREHGGTGLGLALSKKLAVALGGDITVKTSKPRKGCHFIIRVATGDVEGIEFTESLQGDEKMSEDQSSEKKSLAGFKLLLVEDSPDNQVFVSRFLEMEGAQVDIADNGRIGVDKALKKNYDLVLMDIQMPELDGYGALKKLRSLGFEKPVVALTAHGLLEERNRCLDLGFSGHLPKPVNRLGLIQEVRNIVFRKSIAPQTKVQNICVHNDGEMQQELET